MFRFKSLVAAAVTVLAAHAQAKPFNYSDSANRFGLSSLKFLLSQKGGENIVYSPVSAHLALSMALNGAGNQTAEEMGAALNIPLVELKAANSAVTNLLADLNNRPESELKLSLANGLWTRPGLPLNDGFVRTLKNDYNAEVDSLNSPEQINSWAEKKTNGLIKQVIDDINGLEMLLANATYFKAQWTTQFRDTFDGEFTTLDGTKQRTKLMSAKVHTKYVKTSEYEAIDLPYGPMRSTSMILVLPTGDFAAYRSAIDADKLEQVVKGLNAASEDMGEAVLPKVEFKTSWEMNSALQALGMSAAFSNRADFSNMSPATLKISKVKQDAVIKINEEGTEAAAVTTIGIEATSVPMPPAFRFVADRPVLYAIRDNTTGIILFAGQIVKP